MLGNNRCAKSLEDCEEICGMSNSGGRMQIPLVLNIFHNKLNFYVTVLNGKTNEIQYIIVHCKVGNVVLSVRR